MKQSLFLFFFLSPIFVLAQKLNLSGQITGLTDNTTIVLTDLQNPGSALATTKSKEGAFILSAKLEAPSLLGLGVGDNIKTAIFVGNETVKVSGTLNQKADEWKYSGSSVQNEFVEFQNLFVPQFAALNKIVKDLQQADGTINGNKKLQNAVDAIQQSTDEFIQKHPASPVSALAILSVINITDDVDVLDKRMSKLKAPALDNVFGGQLKKAIVDARFNAIGSVALDFTQIDPSGNPVSLVQFRGKYVLIDFWASWCGPCRRENHFLVKTFNKYKDKNFTVLGVSLDDDKSDWLKAIKKDELNWTQVSDLKGWENEVAVKYKVTSIPQNLLIGPDGKILAKNLRGDELDKKLEEILK